ncbi:MAP kinase-activated protein kinase 2 (Fragment) [Seminavis robusta]|uniref:MAP kinase-activated protein kinase 2 n=1 Tax=Seminavis robusta TaxID=568900 RepID=A0A9N8HYS2_9STRA
MGHPNIIKFYDLFQDQRHYYIVMDICKGGDLCDDLVTWGKLEEVDAAVLITQVLSCLNFCHGRKVVHRDIKPDNILLEQTKDVNHVKLIDFGFAKVFKDGEEMTEWVGTVHYMAPEVVNRSYFGASCDMWSVVQISKHDVELHFR